MQILGKNKLLLRQQDIQLAYQIHYESKLMTISDVNPSLVSTIGRIFIDLFYYHHLELPSFQANVYSISHLTLSLRRWGSRERFCWVIMPAFSSWWIHCIPSSCVPPRYSLSCLKSKDWTGGYTSLMQDLDSGRSIQEYLSSENCKISIAIQQPLMKV